MSMHERFAGSVLSKQLEGGRCGAELSFTRTALVATTDDGQLFTIAFRDAQLSLGGALGKMWFCRSVAQDITIVSEQPGFVDALAEASGETLREQLARVRAGARAETQRGYLTFLVLTVGAALLLVALFLGVRHAGRAAVHSLPRSVDAQLAKLAEGQIQFGARCDDEVINQAVQTIVQRLDPPRGTAFEYKPKVVESEQANAFALGDGTIIVLTGLLRDAESAEQVAGVLAHEIAHVERRHFLERVADKLGVVAAIQLLLGDVSGVLAGAVSLLEMSTLNKFGREQERQADLDAVDRMQRVQLDPDALAQLFIILDRKYPIPEAMSWLDEHPEMAQRVREVRARAAQKGKVQRVPLVVDWAEVRRRAGATDVP